MLLLAIETSTSRSSVALATADGVLAAAELGRDRRHGEFVSPAIAELLHHAGCGITDLTHVAGGTGPGLYTGLRVGLVTAATIAATHDLSCVAIAGPDAIAHRVRHSGRRIAVALDARRREVYLATYEPGPDGAVRTGELAVGTPEEAAAALVEDPQPLLLVGDGAAPVAEHLERMAAEADVALDLHRGGPDTAQPTAADLALLAVAAVADARTGGPATNVRTGGPATNVRTGGPATNVRTGGPATNVRTGGPEVLRPVYLRDADARIGWDQRGRLHGGAAAE